MSQNNILKCKVYLIKLNLMIDRFSSDKKKKISLEATCQLFHRESSSVFSTLTSAQLLFRFVIHFN